MILHTPLQACWLYGGSLRPLPPQLTAYSCHWLIDAGGSKIECFLIHQNHHAGNGDNLCLASDVRANFGQIADSRVTSEVMERYVHNVNLVARNLHTSPSYM